MNKIIFHCDCNSFFASCEELLNPELKNFPMAVTGDASLRHGVILAKNEKAKQYNIVTGEPIVSAVKKCPNLVCVLSHHDFYETICDKINSIYIEYSDLVEKASIDESYIDVTNTLHLFGNDKLKLANIIKDRIKNEIGITISIGISFSKAIAKFGSDYKKPDAITLIDENTIHNIYYPADISLLFFAGKKSTEKLKSLGINTIGDLAKQKKEDIARLLGKNGVALWLNAVGKDESIVLPYYEKQEAKSIGNSMTFKRDLIGYDEIKYGLAFLADSVAVKLRRKKMKCTIIQVGIKDCDFRTMQRQITLNRPTNLQKEITEIALNLINGNWSMTQPVRLLNVTALGLIGENEEGSQLSLFQQSTNNVKQEKIELTLDNIRKKYGNDAIKFGYFKNDDTGIK